MEPNWITREQRGAVVVLTLNNPPMNLVTLGLTRALSDALDELARDSAVRALVVTGAGDRAFCAGSDIKEFPGLMQAGTVLERKLRFENETYGKLDDFPLPTVAAVRGLAYGGGLELAVCCDLIVAEEGTRLALPEIKLGVIPGSGGTVRVTRRVGEGRAKELAMLGDPIDARTALAWGLVNRVAPAGHGLETALELATALAARPGVAMQYCKRAIDDAFDLEEDEAIRRSLALSDKAFASEDGQEGVRAFFEKRPPAFKHR